MPSPFTKSPTSTILPPITGLDRPRLAWLLRVVATAWSVARERHALGELDDRMLKDIGIGRRVAEREAGRDLFDIPANRLSRL